MYLFYNSFFKSFSLLLILLTALLYSNTVLAREYFVDISHATGIADGSEANPYRTINEAAILAEPGDVITVRAGVYREEVLIRVNHITFQAYPNEKVIINGTEIVYGWSKVNSSLVYKSLMNWDFWPEEGANQIFVDQKMINLTRWPDQTSDDIVMPNDAVAENVTAVGSVITITDKEFNEPDGRWIGAQIWINLSHNGADGQGWTGGKVTGSSQASHTITVDFPAKYGTPIIGDVPWGMGKNTEFYLFNPTSAAVKATGGVEALLSPGEWWKDGDTLFVRLTGSEAPGELLATKQVIEAKKRGFAFRPSDPLVNRNFITIRNFTLFGTSITTDNSYNTRGRETAEDANNILIEGINAKYVTHFTNHSGNSQDQWTSRSGFIVNGVNNTVKNCTIQYSSGPAVCIKGYGNKILNNVILDANYGNTNSGAVNTGSWSYDSEVAYNRIMNTPMIAIAFKGFTNSNPSNKGVARIHHNEIIDFLRRGYDSGAIDEVGSTGAWTRIDHNLIYNTKLDAIEGPSKYGIYLDFGGGSDVFDGRYIVDHNVIYNVYVPILINHINDVLIYNNTGVLVGDPKIAIVNGNGGTGVRDTIRNNIMGGTTNDGSGSGSLMNAVKENNIFNAKDTVLAYLFVSPANYDFNLKPTASLSINKGLDLTPYNDPLVGLPDIGAFEYGKSSWSVGPRDFIAPTIFPNGGSFNSNVEVSIINSENIGTIHYTLDGSEPKPSSPIYVAPFTISESQFVKAITYRSNTEFSEIASASFVVEIIDLPMQDPVNPTNLIQGLNYEYYEWSKSLGLEFLPDLQTWTPIRTGVASGIDLTTEHIPDYYALRFSGFIEIPTDGYYTFFTSSDDGSKLYIGGTLVVNNDGLHGKQEQSGMVGLKAGMHEIEVDFFEAEGGDDLIVQYKGTTFPKSYIPVNVLWHNAYVERTAKVAITPIESKFNESVKVNMSSSTPNAQIFYTLNGTDPDKSSNLYVGELTFTTITTIKAIAFSDGLPESVIAFSNYNPSVARVTITPKGGSYVDNKMVNLSTSTIGAMIVYTLDGSEPNINSTQFLGPVKIEASHVLKTKAFKEGFAESYLDSAVFEIKVTSPIFSPSASNFSDSILVSITSATSGAKIYYNINENYNPTEKSTLYERPFVISNTYFIKAIAVKEGLTTSPSIKKSYKLITGIIDIQDREVKVYPNPSADGLFSIELSGSLINKHVLLQVADVLGNEVLSDWTIGNGIIHTSKQLKTGYYILNVISENKKLTHKLIVQ